MSLSRVAEASVLNRLVLCAISGCGVPVVAFICASTKELGLFRLGASIDTGGRGGMGAISGTFSSSVVSKGSVLTQAIPSAAAGEKALSDL